MGEERADAWVSGGGMNPESKYHIDNASKAKAAELRDNSNAATVASSFWRKYLSTPLEVLEREGLLAHGSGAKESMRKRQRRAAKRKAELAAEGREKLRRAAARRGKVAAGQAAVKARYGRSFKPGRGPPQPEAKPKAAGWAGAMSRLSQVQALAQRPVSADVLDGLDLAFQARPFQAPRCALPPGCCRRGAGGR